MAQEADHDARIHLAWTTAALIRADEMPPLADLLNPKDPEPQTPATQTMMWDALLLSWGVKPEDLHAAHEAAGGRNPDQEA
jgi:hypothetical protein